MPRMIKTNNALTVFWTNLDDSNIDLHAHLHWLDKTEQKRSKAFAIPALFERFVRAHLFLRATLSQFLLCPPNTIAFYHTEYGKSWLTKGPAFNLSHSGPFAALAVGTNVALGLDIEVIRPHRSPSIRWVLTQREDRQLARTGSPIEDTMRLWVRKEAVMKAIGLGLRLDPATIPIGISPPIPKLWQPVYIGRKYAIHLIDLDFGADVVGALAMAGPPFHFPVLQNCTLADLMDAASTLA